MSQHLRVLKGRCSTFVEPDYLVAAADDERWHRQRLAAVPIIRIHDLESRLAAVVKQGGTVVVPPSIRGVGRGCYITDPVGVLIGLHHFDRVQCMQCLSAWV